MKNAHLHRLSAPILLGLVFVLLTAAAEDLRPAFEIELTPEIEAALDAISADSMRGHLSFIASDTLAGRDTPSEGLTVASEYIAAQFRRAGLAPAGDDGYFQTAHWHVEQPDADSFVLRIDANEATVDVPLERVTVEVSGGMDLSGARLFRIDFDDAEVLEALTAEAVGGAVVLTEVPNFRRFEREQWREIFTAMRRFMRRMAELDAALVLSIDRETTKGSGFGRPTLVDPEGGRPRTGFRAGVPRITVHDPGVVAIYDDADAGALDAEVAVHVGEPEKAPVELRNVIGLLPGSDPELRDTYVMVTAHYDHIGVRPEQAEGDDAIFNGANDDGSGTVSVIELASALATLEPRPRRSIIFLCVFGEERGLLGSRYYGRHPVFPLEKTVADVNLEQVGRTDSTEGPQVLNASMTGIDFSEVGAIFRAAGAQVGIEVYKHPVNSDAFFGRSDNQALADRGVPAHTICVAYEYPDYHGAGDHWDKVDYENMAAVNRMVALGILAIAGSEAEPRWDEGVERAAPYLEAWRELRGIKTTDE